MWSDGQPLTAQDVAFSFTYQKDLELTAFLSALDGIKTVTAPDDATVVIECDRPKADILSMWVPIVPEHIWSKFKTYDEATKYLNEPPIVGSGPFRDHGAGEGQVHPRRGQRGRTGAASPRSTRSSSRCTTTRTRWRRTSSSAPSTSPSTSRRRRSRR